MPEWACGTPHALRTDSIAVPTEDRFSFGSCRSRSSRSGSILQSGFEIAGKRANPTASLGFFGFLMKIIGDQGDLPRCQVVFSLSIPNKLLYDIADGLHDFFRRSNFRVSRMNLPMSSSFSPTGSKRWRSRHRGIPRFSSASCLLMSVLIVVSSRGIVKFLEFDLHANASI